MGEDMGSSNTFTRGGFRAGCSGGGRTSRVTGVGQGGGLFPRPLFNWLRNSWYR